MSAVEMAIERTKRYTPPGTGPPQNASEEKIDRYVDIHKFIITSCFE
jgi:hypothetical protein